MNGIEKIKERIFEENEAKILELKQSATQAAAERTVEYEAKAKEEHNRILEHGKETAEAMLSRMESMAHLEARLLRLGAKQELLQAAFDTAEANLNKISGADYVALLVKLTLGAVSTGKEALVFSSTDRTPYGKKVITAANQLLKTQGNTASLTLDQESRDFQGGLYIKDGSVEINCTFSALIHQCKEQMLQEIAGILFDERRKAVWQAD